MTNNEMRHLERLHDEQTSRMARIETKLDLVQAKCVGCSREFGALSQQMVGLEKCVTAHKANHRWHAAFAASIAGVIVAIAGFFGRLLWRQ